MQATVLEVGDILNESAKNFLKTALSTGKENIENKKDEKVIGKTIEDAISNGWALCSVATVCEFCKSFSFWKCSWWYAPSCNP